MSQLEQVQPTDKDLERQALEDELAVTELSFRYEYGIAVQLGWLRRSNTLQIHYVDEDEGVDLKYRVPNSKGNDAFTHPNSYRSYYEVVMPTSAEIDLYTGEDGS